jgi:hypothetical protein
VTERAALAAMSAPFMPPLGKPGPMLSPRDESPVGENRGGTPAGERARKRRAAQAAFSVVRTARRLRAGMRHGVCRRSAPSFLPEASR